MKVLVTGAGGFLGRELVARIHRAGHEVTALVRGTDDLGFDPSISLVTGDLRTRHGWPEQLGDPTVVVHAAAAAGGDRSAQLASTLVGTENLLDALNSRPIELLILVSSFSVYDFHALHRGARLDENSPLEPLPEQRDGYTEAKLAQEQLVRRWCETRQIPCVVIRPGAIVGPGKPWGYGAEFTIGRLSFVIAPRATFRFVSLANCADAIVRAIDSDIRGVATVNLVDDDLPTNAKYFRMCRDAGAPTGTMVPIPWFVLDMLGRMLETFSRRCLDGRLRTPELGDHRRQEARWKPLEYSNEQAKELLGWRPRQSVTDTVALTIAAESADAQ